MLPLTVASVPERRCITKSQLHSVDSVELVGYNRRENDTRKDEEREMW